MLEDQYAGKATNDVVGAMTAFLKDSPRVNPKKSSPLQALAQAPQVHCNPVAYGKALQQNAFVSAKHSVPVLEASCGSHLDML